MATERYEGIVRAAMKGETALWEIGDEIVKVTGASRVTPGKNDSSRNEIAESGNHAIMCRVAAAHTRKRNRRFEWNALAMDIDYVARKAKALAQNIAGDEEGKAAA